MSLAGSDLQGQASGRMIQVYRILNQLPLLDEFLLDGAGKAIDNRMINQIEVTSTTHCLCFSELKGAVPLCWQKHLPP